MANTEIQIVSSESGEPTAVIVPIELWREIESERETAYLLKSETMKDRLLQAANRQTGVWRSSSLRGKNPKRPHRPQTE